VLCINGHPTHLSCTAIGTKAYSISALKRANTQMRTGFDIRQKKQCGICRKDHFDVIFNGNVWECVNKSMSGYHRAGEHIYGKLPIDMSFSDPYLKGSGKSNSYADFSHNLFDNINSKKYIEKQYRMIGGHFCKEIEARAAKMSIQALLRAFS
jgi:hypothetical protein